MQARLTLCRQYLKEVEEKLIELRVMDANEAYRITETLSFVQQAIDALRHPTEDEARRL